MADASLAFPQDVEAQQSSAISPIVNSLMGMRAANLAELSYMPPIVNPADRSELARLALDPIGLQRASTLALGLTPGIIKAFHGTPHTFAPEPDAPFGAFRDSAIGSGEGAQAYGYGHYVAGNPKVAEGYQKSLTSNNATTYFGDNSYNYNTGWNKFPKSDIIDRAVHTYHDTHGDLDNAIDILRNQSPRYPGVTAKTAYDKAADWLEENRDQLRYEASPGHLLEVHILPDEHELLDWDKPLEGQHQSVIDKVGDIFDKNDYVNKMGFGTGADFYQSLADSFRAKTGPYQRAAPPDFRAASAALHEAGIPGIKYLDAGSRNKQPEMYFNNSPAWMSREPFDPAKATIDYSPQQMILENFYNIWGDPRSESQMNEFLDKIHESMKNRAKDDLYWQEEFKKEGTPYTPVDHVYDAAADWLEKNRDKFQWKSPKQTSNYVIFHPSNLRIVGRDGQRLTPVEGDPFGDASH